MCYAELVRYLPMTKIIDQHQTCRMLMRNGKAV